LIHCNVAVTILPEGLKMGRNKIPSLLICWHFGELLVNWSTQPILD
jgi:hypothetical protein